MYELNSYVILPTAFRICIHYVYVFIHVLSQHVKSDEYNEVKNPFKQHGPVCVKELAQKWNSVIEKVKAFQVTNG